MAANSNTKNTDVKIGAACAGIQSMPGAHIVDYTFVPSTSYTTGGELLTMTEFPNKVLYVIVPAFDDTLTYVPIYMASTKAMKLLVGSTRAEVGSTVDAHLGTFHYQVVGY